LSTQVAAVAAAFAISAVVVAFLRRHAARLPQDAAGVRSLHQGAMPRGGGLAILAGMAVAAVVAPPPLPGHPAAWLAGVAAVAAISLADDVRGVPAAWRLAVQLVAGILVATQVGGGAMPVALAAFAIVWGANLFNFMDGSDGLAAAMAVVGFSGYAIAAAFAGGPWAPYAAVAAATTPFFVVNRPPASMFMGDVGAVTLGFLAAALGVAGIAAGTWPAWFPPLVFLPFLADATLTLAVRLARRERIWEAHRSHAYQRLNTLGAGHRGTLAIYGAAMLACAALAIACLRLVPRSGPVALGAALGALLIGFLAIDYHDRRIKRHPPAPPDPSPRA
jgi:UDP-N-acetylmuramyl pentapeptide phosphotransferase/UDP-N-acetylglucosamine-1-phosphate transferase